MGDTEPELAIFYNQARFLAVELEHQPNHKIFYLQSVPQIKFPRVVMAQNS